MDTPEIVNYLISGGPFGIAAAFFLYRWQKIEGEFNAYRKETEEAKDARAVADGIKAEANFKTITDLQEKRLADALRVESALQSNSSVIGSQTSLLQAIVNQRGQQ